MCFIILAGGAHSDGRLVLSLVMMDWGGADWYVKLLTSFDGGDIHQESWSRIFHDGF